MRGAFKCGPTQNVLKIFALSVHLIFNVSKNVPLTVFDQHTSFSVFYSYVPCRAVNASELSFRYCCFDLSCYDMYMLSFIRRYQLSNFFINICVLLFGSVFNNSYFALFTSTLLFCLSPIFLKKKKEFRVLFMLYVFVLFFQ